MKISVDSHRCQGTALCLAVAPDLFELQDNGVAHVVVDEVPDELTGDADEAVQVCPAAALSIVDPR